MSKLPCMLRARSTRSGHGSRSLARMTASGFQHGEASWKAPQEGHSWSFLESLVVMIPAFMSALAAGGALAQMIDMYSAKYEAMVVPPRQRLTAALSALRISPNRHLADAADRLAVAGDLGKALGYFETNAHRMRYAWFRQFGMFAGSGMVEAGCKAVIGQRMKLSGMRWSASGAADIAAHRCQDASGRQDGDLAAPGHSDDRGLTRPDPDYLQIR